MQRRISIALILILIAIALSTSAVHAQPWNITVTTKGWNNVENWQTGDTTLPEYNLLFLLFIFAVSLVAVCLFVAGKRKAEKH